MNRKNIVDIELIKNAYRKLKSYAYFDKTQSALKHRIVKFENNCGKKLEQELEAYVETINEVLSDFNEESFKTSYQDLINVSLFPKKILETESFFASNKDFSDVINVDETQAFFDADILIHLFGILWVMLIGVKLDESFGDYMYGNRIKTSMKNVPSAKGPSPYLMKPYFEQYETWRNHAIERLELELEQNNDIVMVNIDLKRYFYQVQLKYKDLEDHLKLNDQAELNLTKIICLISDIYTDKLTNHKEFSKINHTVLPIGFYPSMILSNWYLESFDKDIINSKVLFYGRYVDDILMIYSVKERNDLFNQIEGEKSIDDETPKKDNERRKLSNTLDALNKLYCRRTAGGEKGIQDFPWRILDSEIDKVYPAGTEKDSDMFVFKDKHIFNVSKIQISHFDHTCTTAMIKDFKQKLWEHKSEFRLVPEDIFDMDFSKLLMKPKEKEKVLKINSIKLDKFELAKFLGKHLTIAKNIKGEDTKETFKELLKVLDGRNLIEHYLQWENLFTLFVMAKEPLINDLINKVVNSIYLIKNKSEGSIKSSLINHYHASLSRALSLLNEGFIKKLVYPSFEEQISFDVYKLQEIESYRLYNMTNKYHLGIVPSVLKVNKDQEIALFEIENNIKYLDDKENELVDSLKGKSIEENTKYYKMPYNISLTDLQLLRLFRRIKSKQKGFDAKEEKDKIKEPVDVLTDYWQSVNGLKIKESIFKDKIIMEDSLTNHPGDKHKYKRIFTYKGAEDIDPAYVGVGNVRINNHSTYFDSIRNGTEDRTLERYENLKETLNTTIKHKQISQKKTNLFVLPEVFVPFEWIPLLVSTAKKNDMAIITGLEHLNIEGKFYNFLVSIFPVKVEDFTLVNINFHLKVHYAPDEISQFGEKNLVNGEYYEMHKWRGLNISPYCCYELTSIHDRALFKYDGVNVIAAPVFNRDVDYFSNIVESLSRDLDSFIIQANDSFYGDSRIFQPARKHYKHIMRVSGGINHTALISELKIKDLKNHLSKPKNVQAESEKWKIGSIKQ